MIKNYLTSLLKRKQTPSNGTHPLAPTGVVNIADYRDPPFRQGLPVVDATEVLQVEPYSGLIKSIRKFADWRNEEFDEAILPAIETMADYAGLLPASQSYHHTEGGGALLHALEVGLNALRLGRENYYAPMNMLPSHRAPVNRRYQGVLFLAGLLHDIGKIDTDFLVTSKDGSKVWNPYQCSQVIWAQLNNVDRVFLSWNPNRHKNHEARYKGTLARILPKQTVRWITNDDEVGDHGRNLWMDLEDALDEAPKNQRLQKIVIEADQKSTTAWMGVNPGSRQEGLSVPVHSYLLDLMREWVKNGTWKCNVKGGRVWYVRDAKTGQEKLLINWMAAVVDLTKEIEKRNIPGIPRDANRLADVLMQRSFAEPFEDENGELRNYWPFVPERLVKANRIKANRPLYGLCIRNPDHFLQAMGLPAFDNADVGTTVTVRMAKAETELKSKKKTKPNNMGKQKNGQRTKAQSADPSETGHTPQDDEAQSADPSETGHAPQDDEAQSADPSETGHAPQDDEAQSANLSERSHTPQDDEAQSAADAEGTPATNLALARMDVVAKNATRKKAESIQRQNEPTKVENKDEAKVPSNWKAALQMLHRVSQADPDVVFRTQSGEQCVNVDLLLQLTNSMAEQEGNEKVKLLEVRDAFAKETIAQLGMGMLGTIWVRRENPEGTTVRAVVLQQAFAEAAHKMQPEHEREKDKPDQLSDHAMTTPAVASNKKSLTPEDEAKLCETALEYEGTTMTPGGKIKVRVMDGKEVLHTFGLTVEDLDTVKFATMQIWDTNSGYLLIQKTET